MASLAQKNMALGQLITNEILDGRILQAMLDVPREEFVPETLRGAAYADHDLPVGGGRVLQAPLTFAKLLAHAEIAPQSRALVIGAGSGYAAAVAAKLAAHVVATETGAAVAELMRSNIRRLGLSNVDVQAVEKLPDGYALSAPYDVILVCGGVREIPHALKSQLALGGRLAAVRIIAPRPDMPGGMGRGFVMRREEQCFHTVEYFDAPGVFLPGFE